MVTTHDAILLSFFLSYCLTVLNKKYIHRQVAVRLNNRISGVMVGVLASSRSWVRATPKTIKSVCVASRVLSTQH